MDLKKMQDIIKELSEKRKVFVSEDDFKFELAKLINDKDLGFDIRLEFCPILIPNMHIDILLIDKNKKWIPIELKYKTKLLETTINEEAFNLKNQGAKDHGCYAYLYDIHRIETLIKKYKDKVDKGYTIFITNDLSYREKPQLKRGKCYYQEFALTDGIIKEKTLNWDSSTPDGTKGMHKDAISLSSKYKIKWNDYSNIESQTHGNFIYLINEIKK